MASIRVRHHRQLPLRQKLGCRLPFVFRHDGPDMQVRGKPLKTTKRRQSTRQRFARRRNLQIQLAEAEDGSR